MDRSRRLLLGVLPAAALVAAAASSAGAVALARPDVAGRAVLLDVLPPLLQHLRQQG